MARRRTVNRDAPSSGAGGLAASPAGDGDRAFVCRTPGDLYRREGRKAIARALARTLDAWTLTPIELLYDLAAYRRLANAGNPLQSAVQRAALAEVRNSGAPVAERMREIQGLIDAAVRDLHRRSKQGVPDLAKRSLEQAARELDGHAERDALMSMALAADLAAPRSGPDKLARLAARLDEPQPGWVIPLLDAFLADRLVRPGLLDRLLEPDSLAERLEACVRLSTGRLGESGAPPGPLASVDRAVAAGRLPETATALVEHVFEELERNRHATGDTLDREFAALARLLAAAGEEFGEGTGRQPLKAAFEDRCARLLNAETVGSYLRQAGAVDARIDRLLDLAEHVVGSTNLATTADYIRSLLDDPESRAFWHEPVGAGFEQRLKAAARLQRRVIGSRLAPPRRELIAAQLDRYCVHCLERSGLLDPARRGEGRIAERGRRLLSVLAAGEVTDGEARRRVKSAARRHIADPAFLDPIQRCETKAERLAAARELERLLRRAGLDGSRSDDGPAAMQAGQQG